MNTIKPSLQMTFNETLWNNPKICSVARCYDYALNNLNSAKRKFTNNPGMLFHSWAGSSLNWRGFSGEDVTRRLQLDGLIKITEEQALSGQFHALALWVGSWLYGRSTEVYDYHFFRRDCDGLWSHKPGPKPITRLDQAGNIIPNPRLAKPDYHDEFVGYFAIPPEGIPYCPGSPKPARRKGPV